MLIRFFFFFFSIHFVISVSNQEDLSISNYSHIGCLILNPDKQFITNDIQENSLLPYQTFISSNMTIELCFRLCRRWIILMNHNHTNCICLYTLNKFYEFNEYLGEVLSINNCTTNNLQIYSLTKDFYLLPSLSSSIYDWSFDGCYYLHGIQTYHANILLNDVNYTQAIDLCRKNCQITLNTNYFSFFISLKKFCYCLPIKLSQEIIATAVRKPLIHCSFLSYIKNCFENSLNYSEINSDTLVKINVQRYCSSTFNFNRNLYLCLKLISFNIQNTYVKIISDEICLPILIKTYEQWNYLISFLVLLNSRTFISIDRNSTYIFNDLFKSKINSLTSNNLCLIVNRINSNQLPSFDLIPCSTVYSPGYVLCSQKPLSTIISDHAEFKLINHEEQFPIVDSLFCPSEFVLFNKMCYYVDTSFVYNIEYGERICSNKYSNSTLVKFNFHEWGNVNTTRFLGRRFDDILLEFFYYQLEKKLLIETNNDINKKHWLRLLIGNKNDNNECVLRYFIRSSGAFTIFHRCNHGGHPVCQCQPIRNDISKINQTKNNSLEPHITTESSTIGITLPILSNSTNQSIVPICNNCTNLIPDEDLPNNGTDIDYKLKKNQRSKHRRIFMIITGPSLAFVTLIIWVIFLIRCIRRSRGSYSTRSSITGSFRRIKRSSTPAISNDISNTPAVIYSRLKSSPPSIKIDADMINPITNDENVQLLPQSINQTNIHENKDEEGPIYATLKVPTEK